VGKDVLAPFVRRLIVRAHYYQQFDANEALDVPGEGYGGWKAADIPIELERTALVVMHAWETGTRELYPGWHRAVEYIPRAAEISRTIFPQLLSAVRRSRMPLFHLVGGGDYYRHLPGYRRTVELAGESPTVPPRIPDSPELERLRRFRAEHVFVGRHNEEDVRNGFSHLDFSPEARPRDSEAVAENAQQLFALCREAGVYHLVYVGFAINWCLLLSPGGMAEMSARGLLCSTIREATTAVENRETAREERCKEIALWRVALAFGFVFDLDDFLAGLE
jgi:hypothetical protein